MARLWLTYAWVDNDNQDIDYVCSLLSDAGLDVRLDRWTLSAGKRLWQQIGDQIANPQNCDAWAIYATENSLQSEPCREELAYALNRALSVRSEAFPLIGIFPGHVSSDLIPAAIGTRLHVATTDPQWVERVVASVEGRGPRIEPERPFSAHISRHSQSDGTYFIEVRPRVGRWYPFVLLLPIEEKEVHIDLVHGPAGMLPASSMIHRVNPLPSIDDLWWVHKSYNQATPTESFYIRFHPTPSRILAGPKGGPHIELFNFDAIPWES